MQNKIEQLAQQNDMSIEFVTWFFNEKKSACGEHWFLMLGAMWEGWKARSIEMDRLAAENAGLKLKGRELLNEASKVYQKYNATIDFYSGDFMGGQTLHEFQFVLDADTPATDAYLAGIKADAANQMCVAFVKHKELVGLSDDDVVTVREATDAVLHCAEVISEGVDK